MGDPATKAVMADCYPTLTAKTQAGIGVWMDSAVAPTYGLLAYHDGTNAHLDTLAAGTQTSVINAAATYGAAKQLRILAVLSSGTTYSVGLYYDTGSGLAQIGTTQTIDAAAYGTKVCGMSTYSGNSVGLVQVRPSTG